MDIIPPRHIPAELINDYTMNNTIPVYDWYIDERTPVNTSQTLIWTNDYLQSYITRFTFENIKNNTFEGEGYHGASAQHLEAYEKYTEFIKDKKVAVIGSQTPWIEAILFNAGAKSITTVEYNKPFCEHNIIKTITYDDFCKSSEKYDAIFSYSSIEHSGLGRYGDPLNPNGDIDAINIIHKSLIDNGHLFLGVPVGRDVIVWNAHRVYGPSRLELLLKGFEQLEWIGLDKSYIYTCNPDNNGPHPLIVCKKIN